MHQPKSIDELQELVAASSNVRALGTRHSFSSIADSNHELISTEHLNQVVSLDDAGQTVTVEGGITYGKLAEDLNRKGFALHNLASLPHISVAGAIATSTHGSGDKNGSLSTPVVALDLVCADGSIRQLSRKSDPEIFDGAVVALGALGIVARVTLKVEPAFTVRQWVYDNLPLSELDAHFEEITSAAYSVSLFNDWQTETINQVWLKHREFVEAPDSFFGATPAPVKRHPLIVNSAENCTEQLGVEGPWFERLPHFRMDFTPSNGEELQTEYFVPRFQALEAIHAIYELRAQLAPLLYISEIRTIAADELWLSPAYHQACIGIHFTWRPMWPEVSGLLPVIEALLEPYGAIPHWGKLFRMSPERVRAAYLRLLDFQKLRANFDPAGKFRNDFVERFIG